MSNPNDEHLVLIGASGHGKDVLDAARTQGRHVIGFLDDNSRIHGTTVNGVAVLGGLEWLLSHPEVHVIISIGSPAAKQKIAAFLAQHRLRVARPVIHAAAVVSRDASISEGAMIFAGSAIQPQARIGLHAAISTVSTVGHDTIVENFVSCHPGVQIGGEVVLESGSFIGIGATILPGLRIGAGATVGAGAVVLHDVPPRCTAVGVPARVISQREADNKLPPKSDHNKVVH